MQGIATLTEHQAAVGDRFVDPMWEPVIGTEAATFVITSVTPCSPTYVVYAIQFLRPFNGGEGLGNTTACSGDAKGRRV
jgi:hypothetical protein